MFKCSAKPGQAIQVICPILGHTEKREFSLKKKKKGKKNKEHDDIHGKSKQPKV